MVSTFQDLIRNGSKLIFATASGTSPSWPRWLSRTLTSTSWWWDPGFRSRTARRTSPASTATCGGPLPDWNRGRSLSKSKELGFVSAFSIPSVVAGINGFQQGAESVDPDIKTRVVLTSNWYNPPQSTQAAKTSPTAAPT